MKDDVTALFLNMENIMNEKFQEIKLVWEILNPLPEIGYGSCIDMGIAPEQLRKTYR